MPPRSHVTGRFPEDRLSVTHERVEQAPDRTREMNIRVGDGKADAVAVVVRRGPVHRLAVSLRQVSCQIMSGCVAETAARDDNRLAAAVTVLGCA